MVAELINSAERCWQQNVVMEHMQAADASVVLNIPLSSYSDEDSWAWHYEKSGSIWCTPRERLHIRSGLWMEKYMMR